MPTRLTTSLILALYLTGCGGEDDEVDRLRDEVEDLKKQVQAQESSGEVGRGQDESKRAQIPSNIEAIKTAQLSYDASFERYLQVTDIQPDSSPEKGLREFTTGSAFDTIGWMPDGSVRGSYRVEPTNRIESMDRGIEAVQRDGAPSSWTATKTLNPTMNTMNDVY
jgi:hypothetical protein